jgi:hypothetical protein
VNGGAASNVAVKGLGTAAYKDVGYFAETDHSHTVDDSLSSTSENPVQNKVVDEALK